MKCWKKRSVEILVLVNLFLFSNSNGQQKNQFKTAFRQQQLLVELENNTSRHDLSAYLQDNPTLIEEGESRSFSKQEAIDEMLRLVNGDSIIKTIQDLQSFKSRYIYSKSISNARDYLFNRFQNYSNTTFLDTFQFNSCLYFSYRLDNTKNIWIAGENGLVVRSMDMGITFDTQLKDLEDTMQRIFFVDSLHGWCIGYREKIYKTIDGGTSWKIIDTGTKCQFWAISFQDTLNGLICGWDENKRGAILSTIDGGLTWNLHGNFETPRFLDMYFTSADSGWVTGVNGWLVSTKDGGQTWTQRKIANNFLLSIEFFNSQHGWICATSDGFSDGVIYKTNDAGETWSIVESSRCLGSYYATDFIDPQHGWAGGFTPKWTGQIFYTNDGGEHWIKKGLVDDGITDIIAEDSLTCFAVGYYGHTYRTSDGGLTWETRIPAGIQHDGENVVTVKTGDSKPDSVIVIGGHYDSFSGSYDQAPGADDNASGTAAVMEIARILSQYNLPYTMEYAAFSAEEIGLFGSDHYAKEAKLNDKKIKLMINFDMVGYKPAGQKWNVYIASGQENKWPADIAAQMTSTYTLLTPNKAYTAISYGSDQISFLNQGFPVLLFVERGSNPYYHSINDVDSTINVPYEAEIVKAALATIASISGMVPVNGVEENKQVAGLPEQIVLYGNYPNPFNSFTNIKFALPKKQNVELKVFDLRGREVAILADGPYNAGSHTVPLYASGLPSGIYIYRIQIGDFTASRKMVIVE